MTPEPDTSSAFSESTHVADPDVTIAQPTMNKAKKLKNSWFKPELRTADYATGEAYDDDLARELRNDWAVYPTKTKDHSYLTHVKCLSNAWPNLRLLADFMEVGTTPARWDPTGKTVDERESRAARVKVTRLIYSNDSHVDSTQYDNAHDLENALDEDAKDKFTLYVVEDLSRDMIEILGSKLHVDPSFFREHIVDYAWYNVRDPWRNPPNLDVVARNQDWIQIRYVTARYFDQSKGHAFDDALKESRRFNVLRRPDDDCSNTSFWDKDSAKVGLTRQRASLWLDHDAAGGPSRRGVLLLDPTLKSGFPLWRGYRNWNPTYGPQSRPSPGPEQKSFYEDFLFWATQPKAFNKLTPNKTIPNAYVPMQALLHLICSEWLTVSEYINTRLTQVDWEVAFPETFLKRGDHIDTALRKLHMWRRFVPLYRDMVSETLRRAFRFSYDALGTETPARVTTSAATNGTGATVPSCYNTSDGQINPINIYRDDFSLLLSRLEEYQSRIERLTTVVAAVMSIADSRRALADNSNLGRLTWLATLFLPFSLMASAFSMQSNIHDISGVTVKYFFASSVPFAAATLVAAVALSHRRVQAWLGVAQYGYGNYG